LLKSQITKPKFQINLKSQFFNDQNIAWDFEFWSRAAQALAPRVVICPSTLLRVVSLPNHLIFVFWIFGI
jgi:hypothetical protein